MVIRIKHIYVKHHNSLVLDLVQSHFSYAYWPVRKPLLFIRPPWIDHHNAQGQGTQTGLLADVCLLMKR
jgi:hypothetical protein